jgi:hypothetical protein
MDAVGCVLASEQLFRSNSSMEAGAFWGNILKVEAKKAVDICEPGSQGLDDYPHR